MQHSPCYLKQWAPSNLLNKISWDDILDKLDYDVSLGQWGYCNDPKEGMIPTIVAEGFYQPDSFIQLAETVYSTFFMNRMHTYISFAQTSTFGRHNDTMDVFIVAVKGAVKYTFDNGEEYTLAPGDAIHIPAGTYHNPTCFGPRCTLSFSQEEYYGDV